MKVKVTSPMLKVIKKALPDYTVSLVKMSVQQFEKFVDYNALDHMTDYNHRTEKFSVIEIIFPSECYAVPRYLTTKNLSQIFQSSDKTMDGFIKAVQSECCI